MVPRLYELEKKIIIFFDRLVKVHKRRVFRGQRKAADSLVGLKIRTQRIICKVEDIFRDYSWILRSWMRWISWIWYQGSPKSRNCQKHPFWTVLNIWKYADVRTGRLLDQKFKTSVSKTSSNMCFRWLHGLRDSWSFLEFILIERRNQYNWIPFLWLLIQVTESQMKHTWACRYGIPIND